MPIAISTPTPSEAPQIASIHISSMSTNPLLPLQFPTPGSLTDLAAHLAADAIAHLSQTPPRILVARVPDHFPSPAAGTRTTVASFAKWDIVRPPHLGSRRLEPATAGAAGDVGGQRLHDDDGDNEEWPASANREYLTAYSSASSAARKEAMGSRPYLL
ncbi:hypothetical protein CCHL11_06274 [Colletotrichum chlorophyti]|uniref:Uncharacterized protein n=1 Tax=Colletotrichum chlorophyti TaxID=708187 RepID=A0A1Q8RLN2_9PEZI|nr:hypothetical protein CCHL11_06274 [Colletotrichum chlorophyti]